MSANLPRRRAGYDFRFSATLAWLPVDVAEHADPRAVTAQSIVARVSRVTERCALTDRDDVLARLRAVLGTSERDEDGVVTASACDMDLEADEADEKLLRRMATIDKQSEAFDYQRNVERDVRSYFRDEALKTPGSTLMWRPARNALDLDGAERRLGTFARISAVAQDSEPPPAAVAPRTVADDRRDSPDLPVPGRDTRGGEPDGHADPAPGSS